MTAHPLISGIEAINIVGRAIFAKGWIGEVRVRDGNTVVCAGLSSEDLDLIERRGPRPGKRGGIWIEPCPHAIETQLDQALGRRERANAQRGTAAEWLIDHRIGAQRGRDLNRDVIFGYDCDIIIAALKADPPRAADAAARRGRPPISGVIAAQMLQEVASGKRTEAEIKKANDKNLQKWYGADPATCRKAREHAF
jgi:hypothetical protein